MPASVVKATNKATSRIMQIRKKKRYEQLNAALKYCKENNCRGKKAMNAGVCPLIKDPKTINRHLDKGTTDVFRIKEYCRYEFISVAFIEDSI